MVSRNNGPIGILLAGGVGTRLHPSTMAVSKQLLPVFDKPNIYYPLNTLLSAGIREFVLISTPKDIPNFYKIFGNGSSLGISIHYVEQPQPKGIAQSFILAKKHISGRNTILILGDNLFYGNGAVSALKNKETLSSVFYDNNK